MSALRRSASAAVVAFALVSVPAVGAHAAAQQSLHWQTLGSIDGGKVQACRIRTAPSDPWLIKLRVDATKASQRVRGTGQATHSGRHIGHGWASGWVKKRTRSPLGTVRVPRGAGYELEATISVSQAGGGTGLDAGSVTTCH